MAEIIGRCMLFHCWILDESIYPSFPDNDKVVKAVTRNLESTSTFLTEEVEPDNRFILGIYYEEDGKIVGKLGMEIPDMWTPLHTIIVMKKAKKWFNNQDVDMITLTKEDLDNLP